MSNKKTAIITKVQEVASNTYELCLETSQPILFKPGQYITLTLPSLSQLPVLEQFRDMSISSAPGSKILKIAFRGSNSHFKNKLLKDSDGLVELEGPGGVFNIKDVNNSVAVAGGIGITPFISHVRAGVKFPLIYYNQDSDSAAFLDELKDELGSQLIPHFRRPNTVDLEIFKNKHWYIAGPPAMVTSVRTLLKSLMVSDTMITTEEFAGYEQI